MAKLPSSTGLTEQGHKVWGRSLGPKQSRGRPEATREVCWLRWHWNLAGSYLDTSATQLHPFWLRSSPGESGAGWREQDGNDLPHGPLFAQMDEVVKIFIKENFLLDSEAVRCGASASSMLDRVPPALLDQAGLL